MTNPYENTPGAGDSAPLPQQAPQPQVRADQGIVPSVEYVAPPTPVQSAPAQPYPGQPYAPAVPGPPYAGQPDAPYPVPVQQPTGASSWAMGFLAFIPIPFLNVLITGIAIASMYPSVRKKGVPLATENARIAANWGLTLIASHVVLVVLLIALQSARTSSESPLALLWVLLLLAVGVLHLIVTIMGTVKAKRGEVYRNGLAIPFIRASKDSEGVAG